MLFLNSARSGGSGGSDIWLARRKTPDADWEQAINPGSTVNASGFDGTPNVSYDGSTLYYCSERPGGSGNVDLWQVSIDPIVDLNGDGIVDAADMCIMVDHWGENYSLCDIGPIPWDDGIEVAKDTAAQTPLKSADGGLYIGTGKTRGAGTFFSGLINDVRIYDVALSAEEIEAL
jgi:hypothetical protein